MVITHHCFIQFVILVIFFPLHVTIDECICVCVRNRYFHFLTLESKVFVQWGYYYDGPKMIFSLCNFGVKLHNLVFCKYAFLSNTRMHN